MRLSPGSPGSSGLKTNTYDVPVIERSMGLVVKIHVTVCLMSWNVNRFHGPPVLRSEEHSEKVFIF